jgi:lipopolysaccharide transport system ATP-binding protein
MTVVSVENLSKAYRLGQIGTGRAVQAKVKVKAEGDRMNSFSTSISTLTWLLSDLQVWWAKARGKPNPFLKIGQEDLRRAEGKRKGKGEMDSTLTSTSTCVSPDQGLRTK